MLLVLVVLEVECRFPFVWRSYSLASYKVELVSY
jgi:hypothetical protein